MIDTAKKVLMATGITEAEAYTRLQMTARQKRRTMRQVAETIIAIGNKTRSDDHLINS